MPQRQSPRGTHQLRTSSSDSDPMHHRPVAERSPKLGERRSPRGAPQSDSSLNQRKLGSRIADLETQLGQAQDELKILKDQLASAEAAKKEAQEELEKKTKKPAVEDAIEVPEKHSSSEAQGSKEKEKGHREEVPEEQQQEETDVYEVPMEKVAIEPKLEVEQADLESKERMGVPTEASEEEPSAHELALALKEDEIKNLKAKLEEKEKEVGVFGKENEQLKNQLNEATINISRAKEKEEEMKSKLMHAEKEVEASKTSAGHLKVSVESLRGEKEALEAEMKKLRVQTEQWRKAADAAAAVLAGGVEMNGRISDRCSSMDKHFGGYAGFVASPGLADDFEDGFGSAKRKGSGIKMFGELWKKKGHK